MKYFLMWGNWSGYPAKVMFHLFELFNTAESSVGIGDAAGEVNSAWHPTTSPHLDSSVKTIHTLTHYSLFVATIPMSTISASPPHAHTYSNAIYHCFHPLVHPELIFTHRTGHCPVTSQVWPGIIASWCVTFSLSVWLSLFLSLLHFADRLRPVWQGEGPAWPWRQSTRSRGRSAPASSFLPSSSQLVVWIVFLSANVLVPPAPSLCLTLLQACWA